MLMIWSYFLLHYEFYNVLNVCDMYAKEHDIIYNAKKTKCICIRPKSMIDMCDPVFMLLANVLACTKCQNYLGVEIMFTMLKFNITNSSRGKMITSKFRNYCRESIKCRLFQAFCTTIYCSSICSGFTVESMWLLKVAYNRIFRIIMGLKHRTSMSANFVER